MFLILPSTVIILKSKINPKTKLFKVYAILLQMIICRRVVHRTHYSRISGEKKKTRMKKYKIKLNKTLTGFRKPNKFLIKFSFILRLNIIWSNFLSFLSLSSQY